MVSYNGNKTANHFIVKTTKETYFQSYKNIIQKGKSFGPKRDKNKRAMKKKSKRMNRRK